MNNSRYERLLEVFFRGLRGEELSVKRLAEEYEVSGKSITRTLNDLKAFLADHRELYTRQAGDIDRLLPHGPEKCNAPYPAGFRSF